MPLGGESNIDRLYVEVEALRRAIEEMRGEQRAMAQAVEQMTGAFRALATHLGIATEPYRRSAAAEKGRDIPGFA